MKTTISLCIILVATILTLGDGASLPAYVREPFRGKMVTELIVVMHTDSGNMWHGQPIQLIYILSLVPYS